MHEALPDAVFPLPLTAYTSSPGDSLIAVLQARIEADPFNAVATALFLLAVLHTFFAARFIEAAHRVQHRMDARATMEGRAARPSMRAELLHFLGEVEVIFALWGIPLVIAIVLSHGWTTAAHYLNDTVNYTEPMFVGVIMALASTRPIIELAEGTLRRFADFGGGTPGAWWIVILTLGPLLGSLITEPGAMTISALLLARQFYDLQPSAKLKYGTLGLLFVNVSIGGTLTHFAAPPILMVARTWNWDAAFVLGHFGWRATLAIAVSTLGYYLVFRREFKT
ncbi:MAG TPA: putative Na+/H+ antiporter, partial [Vicinamibacterales bacterium]|nr:putative Na+/H+ antiporter [Vicinamibacterales bacterium]